MKMFYFYTIQKQVQDKVKACKKNFALNKRHEQNINYYYSRMYLCNSPAVRADSLRFKEEGVERVLKDVFLPWYNAYRFFMQNVERLERVRL